MYMETEWIVLTTTYSRQHSTFSTHYQICREFVSMLLYDNDTRGREFGAVLWSGVKNVVLFVFGCGT